MPDPIRVTRAVRRCETCGGSGRGVGHHPPKGTNPDDPYGCPNCTDGWVDVPVDEECPTCADDSWLGPDSCPDCGGSGRRLHNWATGWCVGDTLLDGRGRTFRVDRLSPLRVGIAEGNIWYWIDELRLVLSDPSHRPEPMRWKQ